VLVPVLVAETEASRPPRKDAAYPTKVAKIGIAAAAASTPISAEPEYMSRRRRRSSSSIVLSKVALQTLDTNCEQTFRTIQILSRRSPTR
jgi:hypothetical protein